MLDDLRRSELSVGRYLFSTSADLCEAFILDPVRASSEKPVRLLVAVLLAVLGLGHFLFALVNFGYVERLPDNLDVLIEGLGASLAGSFLVWSATRHGRQQRWGLIVLFGGVMFLAGMITSVSRGASSPSMLQVVVPIFAVGLLRLSIEMTRPPSHRSTSRAHP